MVMKYSRKTPGKSFEEVLLVGLVTETMAALAGEIGYTHNTDHRKKQSHLVWIRVL